MTDKEYNKELHVCMGETYETTKGWLVVMGLAIIGAVWLGDGIPPIITIVWFSFTVHVLVLEYLIYVKYGD